MNMQKPTSWNITDEMFERHDTGGVGRSDDDFTERENLVRRVAIIAEARGWNKSHVATRMGMPDGTFSQYVSGKYKGRLDKQNAKVTHWLDQLEEVESIQAAIPQSPKFVHTHISKEISDCLAAAQYMPGMVMVNCEAGMGKTMTAGHYQENNPHVYLATISPHTKTTHGSLLEIAAAVNVIQPNQAQLVRSIGEAVRAKGAGSLLVIDEAQNLVDDAINQMRHFLDQFGCGVALLGNTETYTRFSGWHQQKKYGQLQRRILKRLKRERSSDRDINLFLNAWEISDPSQRKFLSGVGKKPGALGQIDMTIRLAKMAAMGGNRELTLKDLKAAWQNRDVELMQ